MKHIKKIPDTLIIIMIIMLIFIALTWIIPAGEYQRQAVGGRNEVIPNTYATVESSPQNLWSFLTAPIKGFVSAANIIGFCLLVGGAFGVINKTGAINAGLHSLLKICSKNPSRKKIILPLIMVFFSLAGASFGMSETVLVFIMITIPLALALGYDSIVGISISFLAAGAGFAGAVSNPFTIGIAQDIAKIPLFSGWEYRIVMWLILTAITIIFVMRYAGKVEKNPKVSPVYELDKQRTNTAIADGIDFKFSLQRKIVLVLLFGSLLLLIVGANKWKWYIEEISALFIGLSLISAVVAQLKLSEAVAAFKEGIKDMVVASLVIALSKALLIIASDGKIIDSMLHAIAAVTGTLPKAIAVQMMFIFQGALNFFVPSGSGQAALTMPIMTPLSDILGISRQTAVLAFQLGDGIFNMIIPTSGVTMGVLSIAGIPYEKWLKWLFPLMIIFFLVSLLLLIPPSIFFEYK